MNRDRKIKISTIEDLQEFAKQYEERDGKPRDPARISKLLRLLKKYWMRPETTDLRLGQIIGNLASQSGIKDSYQIEDDILITLLEEKIKDNK